MILQIFFLYAPALKGLKHSIWFLTELYMFYDNLNLNLKKKIVRSDQKYGNEKWWHLNSAGMATYLVH